MSSNLLVGLFGSREYTVYGTSSLRTYSWHLPSRLLRDGFERDRGVRFHLPWMVSELSSTLTDLSANDSIYSFFFPGMVRPGLPSEELSSRLCRVVTSDLASLFLVSKSRPCDSQFVSSPFNEAAACPLFVLLLNSFTDEELRLPLFPFSSRQGPRQFHSRRQRNTHRRRGHSRRTDLLRSRFAHRDLLVRSHSASFYRSCFRFAHLFFFCYPGLSIPTFLGELGPTKLLMVSLSPSHPRL